MFSDGSSDELGLGRVTGFAIALLAAGFLLLQAAFRSWRLAALVSAALPVALVGGVLAALVTGAELSLGSMLGLLAVFGLAVRGALVIVTDLTSLRPRDDESRAELVRRGAADHLVPVTTSYAALAALVLPLVVLGTRPGLEILHPLAVVMLGGLVTTGFTTLFLLPALYQHLVPPGQQGLPPEDEEQADRVIRLEPRSAVGSNVPGQRPGPVASPTGQPVR